MYKIIYIISIPKLCTRCFIVLGKLCRRSSGWIAWLGFWFLRKFDAFGTRRTLIRLKCFDWWGKGPPFLYWPRTKQICMHFGTRRLPWISLRNFRHMTDSCWKCHRNSPQQIGSRYTQNTTGCGATLYEVGISCASVPDRKFKPSREVQRRWTLREKTSEGWKAWFIATDGGDSFAIFKGCGCMFSVFTVAKQN